MPDSNEHPSHWYPYNYGITEEGYWPINKSYQEWSDTVNKVGFNMMIWWYVGTWWVQSWEDYS